MSEHEEYMPIYNDPMYWSYLNRDKDNNKKTTAATTTTTTTTTTTAEKKKPNDATNTNTS